MREAGDAITGLDVDIGVDLISKLDNDTREIDTNDGVGD